MPSAPYLSVQEQGGVHVIQLSDSARFNDYADLSIELEELIKDSDQPVLVDLSHLSYCTSDIIGALIGLSHRIDRPVKLCAPNAIIREGLTSSKLESVFEIYDSVDEAIAAA